jgi:hypothetical protein
MNKPPYSFQKISNHGTENPIVARLGMQTADIVQALKLDEGQRQSVSELYAVTIMRRMLKVFDAHRRLQVSLGETLGKPRTDNELPYVIGLEDETDSILVEAKSILRDSLALFPICFPGMPEWDEAKHYIVDRAGGGSVRNWAAGMFGSDSRMVGVVDYYQPLVRDVVNYRNAREHPGGRAGTLAILNFRNHEGALQPPDLEYRKGDQHARFPIFPYIQRLEDGLLYFAEDVLGALALELRALPQIVLEETPKGQRKKEAPVRLRWNFATALQSR